ncbi:MAG: ATP-binding protein [Verrucomicrobia bacterium]|nr:ATP-binding protein [Verrucomicrobiota bacterium]
MADQSPHKDVSPPSGAGAAADKKPQSIIDERNVFRSIFNQAPLMIWCKDTQNNILLANETAARAVNMTPEAMMNRSTESIYGDAAKQYYEDDLEVIQSGQPKLGIVEQLKTSTGTIWIQTDKFPWRDDNGVVQGVVVFVMDITDRKTIEEKLQTSQRMESLGVLAGGIAHDFNNLLTGIIGNVELAALELEAGHPALPFLQRACSVRDRAKRLTLQLLTFARGGAPIKSATLMEAVITDATSFALSGSNSKSDIHIASPLWPCVLDRTQIDQVIDNLVLNAQEAMPAGGTVTVRADNVSLARNAGLPLPPGDYVRIAIGDSGSGIEPDAEARIFDPFFSTKAHGSGLGLTIAFSIVKRHAGHLGFRSTPGKGTTFTVHLPAARNATVTEPVPDAKVDGGGERILFLDDEAFMQQLGEGMLQRLGYDVTCVADTPSAISAFTDALTSNQPYAAVIVDLTIPGEAGGLDTLKQLRALDPDVKAIVSSGYSNDPVMAGFAEHGFSAVLPKPYSIEALSRILQRVIISGKTASPS